MERGAHHLGNRGHFKWPQEKSEAPTARSGGWSAQLRATHPPSPPAGAFLHHGRAAWMNHPGALDLGVRFDGWPRHVRHSPAAGWDPLRQWLERLRFASVARAGRRTLALAPFLRAG
jgi:hypothetical protein